MKSLLIVTAIVETGAGLALIALPTVVVRLLLGAEVVGASIPLGRVAGAALLALGVACWRGTFDAKSLAASGILIAMLLYNVSAVVILGVAGIQLRPVGVALW